MNLSLGEVVSSKAGRDSGKKFVVLETLDRTYVLIADGDLRRVEKPKKKKVRHLEATGRVIQSLQDKLANKLKITNAEIRKALAASESGMGEMDQRILR